MSKRGEKSEGQVACDAIRKLAVELLEPITFGTTIDELYAKDLIDAPVYEAATNAHITTQDKGRKILIEVQKKVKTNPKLFEVFCDILWKGDTTKDLSKRLRDSYKIDGGTRDATSQMKSLTIKPDSVSEESVEFVELKGTLRVLSRELNKMKGQSKESFMTCIKTTVSDYIDKAYRSGVSEETIHQQIQILCHRELLIPNDLTVWAIEQVDIIATSNVSQVVQQCTEKTQCLIQHSKPLLFNEKLHHSIICCNAVTACDGKTYRQYLEAVRTEHHFQDASMTDTANTHQYLIARENDKKLIYVAFKSESNISKWSEGCSFEKGIQGQMDQIPVRFFVEQLKDQWDIVLTGFSFGGILACYVAAGIWNSSVISPEEFKSRVICITFGQPLISIPFVENIIESSCDFRESVHLIFDDNDVIPRLLRFTNFTKTQSGACIEKADLIRSSPSACTAMQATQNTPSSVCLRNLGILQAHYDVTCSDAKGKSVSEIRSLALANLQIALKAAVQFLTSQDSGSHLLKASCYIVSPEKQLVLIDKDKRFDGLCYFRPSSIDELNENLFKQHNMKSFDIKTSTVIPSVGQHVQGIDILKPRVEGVAFHCYGSTEVAVVVQGDQLWFCYEICLDKDRIISTPAQHITRKSIQFNYTPSEQHDISTSCDTIKVTLHSHFCEPVIAVVEVKRKVYPCTLRQAQLAKHTPTEIIQLAYLCAMLEQPSYKNSKRVDRSDRLKTTIQFLDEAVNVVPVESIFYAIAYGDNDVAIQCSKALEKRKPTIPPSEMMIAASQYAAIRLITGCHKEFIDQVDLQIRKMNICFHNSLWFPMKIGIAPHPNYSLQISFQCDVPFIPMPVPMPVPMPKPMLVPSTHRSRKASKARGHLYSDVAKPNSHLSRSNTPITQPQFLPIITPIKSDITINIPIPPKDESSLNASPDVVKYLHKFAEDSYNYGCSKIARKEGLAYVSGLSINEVYQTSSKSECILSSPTEVLSCARLKLSELVKLACKEGKGIPFSVSQDAITDTNTSSFHNLEMLKTINNVRTHELNLCTTLLSAFMEQQIRIPLINSSPLETASALSMSPAPIAVGVWALFSLNYGDIKETLASLHGKPLMVDITNYIMGIYNSPLKMEDARYAGKLQFLLQSMDETISCNSQYVSYSLERQLVDLFEKRLKTSISLSIDLEDIISRWDTIFHGDALSLVAKPHRSLIARWLKWALMIHQLREKLAEYTAVGVIGLTNSGKSHLVNKLFGVQTLVGTTQMKRTTIPLMYNMNGGVKKLDVIDFPGVDDQDETIPELSKLLVGLAQIIIFVVDYRKIHTQSSRSWLTELESEKEAVPILVCLTHADRLHAEIMAQENNSKDKPELCKRYIRSELNHIKERLGHSPSRDVDFYSFTQEPDSNLNNDKGRKMLNDVGIHRIQDVGVWIIEKLKTHLGQPDLASKLQEYFQKLTK